MNLVILSPEIDEQGSGHPENLVIMSPKLDEQGTRQPDNPVLMPPEIDEQVSRQSENPEEKKSKFMLNKGWILNNIIVTTA